MPAEKGLFMVCRKTGRIVGINRNFRPVKWLFPVVGLLALIWYLVRVLPKPSRACYPCQRAAAPLALGGMAYFLSLFGLATAFRKTRKFLNQHRYAAALGCLVIGLTCAAVVIEQNELSALATESTGSFVPVDGLNYPIGVARGIYPGRVAWSYNTNACNWDGVSSYWWSSQFNNQTEITKLMANVICSVAGQSSVSNAWDALFRYKNGGPAAPSYVKGQSIAIKINENNGGNNSMIDASPQSVYALLDSLVNQFGASQSDITLCDPARSGDSTAVQSYCQAEFPNVNYNNNVGNFTANAFAYSVAGPTENSLATTIVNTKYLITMALLKRHTMPYPTYGDSFNDGNSPVTMLFKSDWGIIGNNRANQHTMLHTWEQPIASYDLLVDIYGSTNINNKTVLTLLDGLYSGFLWNSGPTNWVIAPFNGHYPSSIFASQDPVALESVGLDFIWADMGLVANADRHLREGALANNPPSGTVYAPDGVRLQSLGVHEHWNNSTNKQFSRNLGTGLGIELVTIAPGLPAITIAGLASGNSFLQGTNIALQACVVNNTNPISKVVFYQNGTQILGSSGTSPYAVAWSNAPAGNWTLTAVATDSSGLSVTSNPVNLSVNLGTLAWDSDPNTPGAQDGGGVWALATANWWNGSSNLLWSSILPVNTVFGAGAGAAGTITLGTNITAGNLAFNPAASGNYTIAGGGYVLTLAGTPAINVTNGLSPTISAPVAGAGFSKTGNGTLTLSGTNTFAGTAVVNGGTLVLSGNNSGAPAGSSVVAGGTLQLAGANGLTGALALNSGSTLQLRADGNTTFAPAGIALDSATDTNNFDVNSASGAVTGQTLSLAGALAFGGNANQTINVTGGNSYTLALGAITATASTDHSPYRMVNVNAVPGVGAIIASFTSGNWGTFLNLTGGGQITVAGNLGNTSNGSTILFVNNGTTATLQGISLKSGVGDAYRYFVPNGTLVVDNNGALINNTTGTGLTSSLFILGAATNIMASGSSAPAGLLIATNNGFNCAVYLGDANFPNGGLTLPANVTNYVSDGDVGFANSGTFTIGGQNTGGTNTYANPIILGWTPNRGKSVTLAAATGGTVNFTGGILQNGSSTTAKVTVGNSANGGIVKLSGANTYAGGTTVANGKLLVNGSLAAGAVAVQGGGTLGGGGTINGPVTVQSGGTLAPGESIGTLTVNNSLTLAGNLFFKLNKSSAPSNDLAAVSGTLINAGSGMLTITNYGPALVSGDTFELFNKPLTGGGALTLNPGTAPGTNLRWINNLAVNGTVSVTTVATNSVSLSTSLSLGSLTISWPADHIGWHLQAQTNALGVGLGTNWVDVGGTINTNQFCLPINAANGNVFLRLIYP